MWSATAQKFTDRFGGTIYYAMPDWGLVYHYLVSVYPGDIRDIGIIFEIEAGNMEYFNLGVNAIFRENYVFGKAVTAREKGHKITESYIGCGTCTEHCPQRCIGVGMP